MPQPLTTCSHQETEFRSIDDLRLRIRSEFAEMPGLTLTLPQASRLFALEATQCALALGHLVADGVLCIDAGRFVRTGAGRRSA